MTALSARKVCNTTRKRPTAAQRNRVLRPINRTTKSKFFTPVASPARTFQISGAFLVPGEGSHSISLPPTGTNK